MLRKILLLGLFTGGCASLPVFHELNPQAIERWVAAVSGAEMPQAETPVVPTAPKPQPTAVALTTAEPLLGRKVLLRSDPRGHFIADFKLNGRGLQAMVDTGATVVAINRSTARRIGLRLAPDDFKYEVQTANGSTRAASAMIDRIQIGRISVEAVEAVVLDDKALDGILVGMSFLNRLSKFEVQNGALVMQQ
jgi:aspartyl protease family protein